MLLAQGATHREMMAVLSHSGVTVSKNLCPRRAGTNAPKRRADAARACRRVTRSGHNHVTPLNADNDPSETTIA